MNKLNNKNMHLTLEEREIIYQGLCKHKSAKEIAELLGKDPTTISKELKLHREPASNSLNKNTCKHRNICKIKNLCHLNCTYPCNKCNGNRCNSICSQYVRESCKKINRFPHVCNGCNMRLTCRAQHYLYNPYMAQKEYASTLSYSRVGLTFTNEELLLMSSIVKAGLDKGQPLAHIYQANIELQKIVSIRRLYSLIENNMLQNLDSFSLRRHLSYKLRKKTKEAKVRANLVGRKFKDFLTLMESLPKDSDYFQMDTVLGSKKCLHRILTMLSVRTHFMIAILITDGTMSSVVRALNSLQDSIGLDNYSKLFSILLTDNGSEFMDIDAIENNLITGIHRSDIFFCNPSSPYEKGAIEKNHEFLRYIIPKGVSFENLTQDKLNLALSHINCTFRPSLNGKTPYEAFKSLYGEELIKKLGQVFISPNDLNLTPNLIK